ncbi:hypothetical protein OPQ81_000952 [Rhizoctonia solani]|nr:hypothetical protein OPQ81_000952 [Rhizoctonia solani]
MPSHSSMPAPDAAAEAEAQWLTEALLGRSDCDIFRKLEELRHHIRAMGFTPCFRSPAPASSQPTIEHADVMYWVLQCMDQASELPKGFARHTAWFLDIGSKSEGFSRYILGNPRARGVGVNLDVWAASPSNRFELCELNLFDLVSCYLQSDLHSLPLSHNKFDFIILDEDPSKPRLLVAQLLLALHTVHDGGQILMTLQAIERPLTARILIAFSRIADLVSVSKPQVQTWGSHFYMHAQTIRVDTPAYWKLKDNLHRLWNQTHTTHTRDPTWDEEDLITPWEEVMDESCMDLIAKLGNPLWGTQLKALNKALSIVVDH